MLLKAGVDISRLERNTRRSLTVVAILLAEFDLDLIITSTYDGNHMPGSLHYAHQAYDIRRPVDDYNKILTKIRSGLGNRFDVVLRKDHIHIEYDPK